VSPWNPRGRESLGSPRNREMRHPTAVSSVRPRGGVAIFPSLHAATMTSTASPLGLFVSAKSRATHAARR
jgi:hypothetical protein